MTHSGAFLLWCFLLASVNAATAVEEVVSFNKPTTQSSRWGDGFPQRGVDGDTGTNFNSGACTHTNSEWRPWWEVDLLAEFDVKSVKVTNRGDCCWDRLKDFYIVVHNGRISFDPDEETVSTTCAYGERLGRGATGTFSCKKKAVGRFVRIGIRQQSSYEHILTLCDVQVTANVEPGQMIPVNVALKGTASQSSTWESYGASLAIDDKVNPSFYSGAGCTHTKAEYNAHWIVRLDKEYEISYVAVTNRADYYERFRNIDVGDTTGAKCKHLDKLGKGQTRVVLCKMKTSVVSLEIQGSQRGILTVCEVQVYALLPYEPKNLFSAQPQLKHILPQ